MDTSRFVNLLCFSRGWSSHFDIYPKSFHFTFVLILYYLKIVTDDKTAILNLHLLLQYKGFNKEEEASMFT